MKKIRRRKFNFTKFILFLLFLFLIIYLIYNLLSINIKNIIVKNTYFLTDEEVIETAKLENYPSFFKTSSNTIKNRLLKHDLINKIDIKKKFGYVVEISVKEYKVLFLERSSGKYILDNKTEINMASLTGVPTLINYVVDSVKEKLIEKLSEVDYDVLTKISEIEYSPTSYDEERFLLYMNDGNLVYITLNKIDEFKKYIEIKQELEGKKGILYLDSGNYFEIKE